MTECLGHAARAVTPSLYGVIQGPVLLSEWDPKSFLEDIKLDGEGEHMLALDLCGALLPHDGFVNAECPKDMYLSALLLNSLLLELCWDAVLQDYLVVCKIHRQHLVQSQVCHSLLQLLYLPLPHLHLSSNPVS